MSPILAYVIVITTAWPAVVVVARETLEEAEAFGPNIALTPSVRGNAAEDCLRAWFPESACLAPTRAAPKPADCRLTR